MLFEFLEILDFIEKDVNRECVKHKSCNECKYTSCADCCDERFFEKIREFAKNALK